MNTARCSREEELIEALERGFVGAELAGHLASCEPCSELHSVAAALLDEKSAALAEAGVPSAGTMWWRLQMRHRREAQAMASRSLLIGQAASLVVALVLLGSLFGSEIAAGMQGVVAKLRLSTPILVAIATWLLAAPVAGWIAIRQK